MCNTTLHLKYMSLMFQSAGNVISKQLKLNQVMMITTREREHENIHNFTCTVYRHELSRAPCTHTKCHVFYVHTQMSRALCTHTKGHVLKRSRDYVLTHQGHQTT